jgi:hypothetical protein
MPAIIAKRVTAFDKLVDQLIKVEQSVATAPVSKAEHRHRMGQGKALYRAGLMSAQSLSTLHQIMVSGPLPERIADALDRAAEN